MSGDSSLIDAMSPSLDLPSRPHTPDPEAMLSLEALQSDEQRRFLDMIVDLRKCGLEGILPLPQIVVCGDQSAGKSSVLEALTGISFPRNDNLCTRHATEIILRCNHIPSVTIKVIPDAKRPLNEQENIRAFNETASTLDELPRIMSLAMAIMGVSSDEDSTSSRAFARDVLSIEISGPGQPQLTLVDIPGLIATTTRGITKADVDMVAEITDHYIAQSRTVCLAVVCATNDYANQKILEKVRDVDPEGERTLGIITKPDGPAEGSGSQKAFIALANNEDIVFKLGWHVIKNRSFEERDFTLEERNIAEEAFFRTRAWSQLPPESLGIDNLRVRLCALLYEHIKKEVPKLQADLEERYDKTKSELEKLGTRRSSPNECKSYLSQMSLDFHETCRSAVNGQYEGDYFLSGSDEEFSLQSTGTTTRARAVIQFLNSQFEEMLRLNGHKYQYSMTSAENDDSGEEFQWPKSDGKGVVGLASPKKLDEKETMRWVGRVLQKTRGRELIGNFNPLLIGALFWEQSLNWEKYATTHVHRVNEVCRRFLLKLLEDTCPKDVESRIWMKKIEPDLKKRLNSAMEELKRLVKELKDYPINYNHYYTDTIAKRRQKRQHAALEKAMADASTNRELYGEDRCVKVVDSAQAIANFSAATQLNMNEFACEEVLDCLFAIYKVMQKTFIANVTTQVIERHIVRGLENIFSPTVVSCLGDEHATALACEPANTKRLRASLEEQVKKLEEGHEIFMSVM